MEKSNGNKKLDVCLILLVLLLNPLLSTFFFDTKSSLPDTFAYIAQAQNLLNNVQFHTGPWSHVDISLILPPLYPALIAISMSIGMDGLESALLISQLSGYLFSLAAFVYIRSIAGSWLAAISVLTIQLTYIYFNFASLALTESLFLALTMATLLLVSRSLANHGETGVSRLFAIGLACSLVFLCREVGITLLLLALILAVLVPLNGAIATISTLAKQIALVMFGFSLLTVPFYTLRSIQTGADPLTRSFRLGNYTVETSDHEIIQKLRTIKEKPGRSYTDIYIDRRKELELLPDSSEMLKFVLVAEDEYQGPDIVGNIVSTVASPVKYLKQFFDKLILLRQNAGTGILLLFIITTATSFLLPLKSSARRIRIVIPLFVLLYILLLSVFSSQIGRYIAIIAPLLLVHICVELQLLLRSCKWPALSGKAVAGSAMLVVFPLVVLAGSPELFYAKQIYPRDPVREERLKELRERIKGEPVFTQFPVFAHAAGGVFRQLPNDSLEKVVRYAEKTGVRWLLLVDLPEEREVIQYWEKAYEWLTMNNLEKEYPELIHYCCGWRDTENGVDLRLYSFLAIH